MLNYSLPDKSKMLAAFVLIAMCFVIGSALAFEHVGGYIPCKLCLEQREPWYLGIPIMMLAVLGLFLKWPAPVLRLLLLAVGLVLLYSLVLGVRHAGVEWAWWEGPGDCGSVESNMSMSVADLAKGLEETIAPSCTEASLRVLGLSFAGWNALGSLVLSAVTLKTALTK